MFESFDPHLLRPDFESFSTDEAALKALRAVAKALNDRDWSPIMEVTDDFLVAAVDDHGETDPVTDIKAVIPAAKFRSLRKQGFF